jgi:hypothetical protein
MKKNFKLVFFIVVVVLAFATIAFAWGNKNATGRITSINHPGGSVPFVTVQGYTEKGSLWLGFSYKCGGGEWIDRDPKKVKGNFSERFTMGLCPQGYTQIRSCLWKGKDGRYMAGKIDCMDR